MCELPKLLFLYPYLFYYRETGINTWEEAEERLPSFVTAEALDEFRSCSFKSSIPARCVFLLIPYCSLLTEINLLVSNLHRFKDYCQLALRCTQLPPPDAETVPFCTNTSTAILVSGTVINFSVMSENARANGLDFTGASFTLINLTRLTKEVTTVYSFFCILNPTIFVGNLRYLVYVDQIS